MSGHFERQEEHIQIQHAAFAFGLLWRQSAESRAKRRNAFPSWSWAGWIGPIQWPHYSANSEADSVSAGARFYVQVEQGGTKLPINIAVRRRYEQADLRYPLYLRIDAVYLRIDAEVVKIRFSLCLDRMVGRTHSNNLYGFPPPVFVFTTHSTKAGLSFNPELLQYAFWVLTLTSTIEEGNELWSALCDEGIECVVLSRTLALVIWKETRVGLLPLRAFLKGSMDSSEVELYDRLRVGEELVMDIRERLGSERRSVIIR